MNNNEKFFSGRVFQNYGSDFKYVESESALHKLNSAGLFEWYCTVYGTDKYLFSATMPFLNSGAQTTVAYDSLKFINQDGGAQQ